ILLVGETPTAGVHKEALLTSLDFVQAAMKKGITRDKSFRLLAPCFSGPATALRLTMRSGASQQQKNTPRPFKFISGPAYSVDPTCFEECAIDADAPRPTFQATVVPGKILLKEMIQFLKQRDSRMRRVALLTEADTDYGRKTLDRPNPNKETAKMAPG